MKTGSKNPNVLVSVLLILFGLVAMPEGQNAHALSAKTACERPNFKFWKKHQEARLWAPDDETLLAERSGKVFTYNCFTVEEIDTFFRLHEDRIENANFTLILEPDRHHSDGEEEDEACD